MNVLKSGAFDQILKKKEQKQHYTKKWKFKDKRYRRSIILVRGLRVEFINCEQNNDDQKDLNPNIIRVDRYQLRYNSLNTKTYGSA